MEEHAERCEHTHEAELVDVGDIDQPSPTEIRVICLERPHERKQRDLDSAGLAFE